MLKFDETGVEVSIGWHGQIRLVADPGLHAIALLALMELIGVLERPIWDN